MLFCVKRALNWYPRKAALDYSIRKCRVSFIGVQHDEAKRTASPNRVNAFHLVGDFYAAVTIDTTET